jgi:hypothetical protein
MEKSIEEKKWMPKIGGKYWTVHRNHVGYSGVKKEIWEGNEIDICLYKKGEVFKTKPQRQ